MRGSGYSLRRTTSIFSNCTPGQTRISITATGKHTRRRKAEDGEFRGEAVGREGLVALVQGFKQGNGLTRHMNMSMVIEGTSPNHAAVSSYLVLQNHGVTPAVARITGAYHDELVKTPQGRLFKKRKVQTDSQ